MWAIHDLQTSTMQIHHCGVLYTLNLYSWNDILCSYEAAASSMGLHAKTANWLKTKLQNIGSRSSPEPVSISTLTVDSVMMFTYLGLDVDSNGYCTPEMHRCLVKANSVMGQLDGI
jgi:hypothetical protein